MSCLLPSQMLVDVDVSEYLSLTAYGQLRWSDDRLIVCSINYILFFWHITLHFSCPNILARAVIIFVQVFQLPLSLIKL